jgi:hypothetical protein
MKLGCGCGPIAPEKRLQSTLRTGTGAKECLGLQKPVIIQALLWRDKTFIARCFSSGDGTTHEADMGGEGDHNTLDVPSRETRNSFP